VLTAGRAVRAILINTGNANAGTGTGVGVGLERARSTCAALAGLLGSATQQVLPFSTGVIMETLNRIETALPAALADCRPDHWGRSGKGHHDDRHRPQGVATGRRGPLHLRRYRLLFSPRAPGVATGWEGRSCTRNR
jgi:hypothetical protein